VDADLSSVFEDAVEKTKKEEHHLKGALGFRIPTLYRPLDKGKAFEF
jgi:hypothetical protein